MCYQTNQISETERQVFRVNSFVLNSSNIKYIGNGIIWLKQLEVASYWHFVEVIFWWWCIFIKVKVYEYTCLFSALLFVGNANVIRAKDELSGSDWTNNEEIEIFREYLRIPTISTPDVDYSKANSNLATAWTFNPM